MKIKIGVDFGGYNNRTYEINCNSSENIKTLLKRIRDESSFHIPSDFVLYHKNREMFDHLLVKDYNVQQNDAIEYKKKERRDREDYDEDYEEEMRRRYRMDPTERERMLERELRELRERFHLER